MPAACRSSCRGSQQRLVVNCGLPAVNKENWRQVARATAAHSTVTFNDTSSCRFLEAMRLRKLLSGIPIVAGPHHVRLERGTQAEGRVAARFARRLRAPISASSTRARSA